MDDSMTCFKGLELAKTTVCMQNRNWEKDLSVCNSKRFHKKKELIRRVLNSVLATKYLTCTAAKHEGIHCLHPGKLLLGKVGKTCSVDTVYKHPCQIRRPHSLVFMDAVSYSFGSGSVGRFFSWASAVRSSSLYDPTTHRHHSCNHFATMCTQRLDDIFCRMHSEDFSLNFLGVWE